MKVFLKDLSKELQKEIKSILKGNGLKVKDSNIFKDGNNILLEIKNSGKFIKVNF